jgi:hypothetical protein
VSGYATTVFCFVGVGSVNHDKLHLQTDAVVYLLNDTAKFPMMVNRSTYDVGGEQQHPTQSWINLQIHLRTKDSAHRQCINDKTRIKPGFYDEKTTNLM